jgi:peptide deformylase
MKQIIHVPNLVLTTPAKKIISFDKRLTSLIADMTQALLATKNPKGVGLAAPQIDEPYAVFITKPTAKATVRTFINPVVEHISEESTKDDNRLEGCLSIPKIWGKVKRAEAVTLSFQDETGEKHTETFTDFMATIVQHEVDHLNGIIFTKRTLEQKGKIYQVYKNKEGKEELEEIVL